MALTGSAFLAPAAAPAAPPPEPLRLAPPRQAAPRLAGGVAVGLAAAGAGAALAGSRRRQGRAARRALGSGRPVAIPVLPEPAYRKLGDPLLAEMDAGFDPLDLATKASPWGDGADSYYNYREAEVKHGRLAMLATVGWLSSEELQAALARRLGLADELAPGELAPSLVNGGLGNLPAWFLPAVFAVSAWIELVPRQQGNRAELLKYKPQRGRLPGDLSFDPLGLRAALEAGGTSVGRLHNAEVKHGRAAMVAITAFVLQEFLTKVPVVREDELSADGLVAALDKGIEAVDKAAGLSIPDIPLPFPLS